jgi:hypothetical protein
VDFFGKKADCIGKNPTFWEISDFLGKIRFFWEKSDFLEKKPDLVQIRLYGKKSDLGENQIGEKIQFFQKSRNFLERIRFLGKNPI